MNLNPATTPNPADGPSALLPTRKPKAYHTEFATAHRACRTIKEREQLALVLKARWTEAELAEYARLFFFRNGKDYPTAASYRNAIADIAAHLSVHAHPFSWLKLFRKGKAKPLPPRREGLLQRGRGNGPKVSGDEYAYPDHTEEFRALIEQRARDYFGISPERPVHVNAWAASQRAYWREWEAETEALRKVTEPTTLILSPKKKAPKSPRRKLASQFDYSFMGYQKLKPHFNIEFEGHTDAFREEVAAWARKDNHLRPNAYVSPRRWKIACHKHYVLLDVAAG
jgi:hypothetical protein